DGTSARLASQTAEDVLEERVVSIALWGCAVEVPPPGVRRKRVAIPLLDRIRRVCQNHVELHQFIALHELRLGERISAHDLEVVDSVEKAIHPGYRGSHQVSLLPEETHIAPLQSPAAQ